MDAVSRLPECLLATVGYLDELGVPYEIGAPLGDMTWYGVGGKAEVLVRPRSVEELGGTVKRCNDVGVELRVIGGGANLLVDDCGVGGVVVRLDAEAFMQIGIDKDSSCVEAGSGVMIERLIAVTVGRGLSGLEVFAGIPGTVGGTLIMNAGGRFGVIGDSVKAISVVGRSGKVELIESDDLEFGYRQLSLDGGKVIISAKFELSDGGDVVALRAKVKEIIKYKQTCQPMGRRTAGCVFKNPPIRITTKSAAELIDQAELKGHQIGGAQVSVKHANFIVTRDNATAGDVLSLMAHVRKTVAQKFGIELRPEIVIWPDSIK